METTATTVITYWLVSGDPDNVFTIRQTTGALTTTKRLDREQRERYELTIVARGISKVVSTTVTVIVEDVNDNRPRFDLDSHSIAIPEDSPIESAVFVTQV